MSLDLPLRYGDHIVVDVAFLEVRVNTHELNMLSSFLQATTVLDDLFQTNTGPPRCTDCAFSPLCLSAGQSRGRGAS